MRYGGQICQCQCVMSVRQGNMEGATRAEERTKTPPVTSLQRDEDEEESPDVRVRMHAPIKINTSPCF